MRSQTGARFIKRERQAINRPEIICTHHVKRESKLIRVSANVVKRGFNYDKR